MSTTFSKCGPDEWPVAVLEDALKWHKPLDDVDTTFCVLLAANENDAPLKVNGHAVLGRVKIVPLLERVAGLPDVLILIDSREWENLSEPSQLALMDHLLCRLELVTHEVADGSLLIERDDAGRPKLRKRPADWHGSDGFRDVVERHGRDAVEFIAVKRANLLAVEAVENHEAAEEKARMEDAA